MATLQKITEHMDENGVTFLAVEYTVEDDLRKLYLLPEDTDGLTAAQVLALAQARIAEDTALPANNEREDIFVNPARGARVWYGQHQAALLLFTLSIADLEAEIADMVDDLNLDNPLLPATASAINRLKLLLAAKSINNRVFATKLGLLD